MLGHTLLAASRKPPVRRLVTSAGVSRRLVDRFVAGDGLDDAVDTARNLLADGLSVTIDHLGEDTHTLSQATDTRDAYIALLDVLGGFALTPGAEVSLKLSAIGQALPEDGHRVALDNARAICLAAERAGSTVTLDMEDHTTVDSTLAILRELRHDHPWVGVALQSALHRTEADCAALAHTGSRVRLVKGAYAEPATVAHQRKADVDLAYVRCLKTLMAGGGYPMVATHDPRMIAITEHLVAATGRAATSYEFQMLHGIRVTEQHRLRDAGAQVRVYLPYGSDWYGYFMRRLAERPANLTFFLRSLFSR
ncbi:proline dehydrogenase family protein [Nocardioides limicola]|uniref:proline dehydrogenase family protein n=1 Tax=Nocardioides limicola TaxID=2803368 RepID=UPI00193C1E61|nr:proline dehydrogenase family protein [Nocardioides sp. DJM-14]